MTAMQSTRQLLEQRPILFPLNVKQYHRMIESGIVPEGEPYELVQGLLLHKDRSATGQGPMTVGHAHSTSVQRLMDLGPRLKRSGCIVRVQQPVTLPPLNEPEPDGAIVRGSLSDYAARHPGPADIFCVVEVADASLRRDRTTKLGVYAEAAIPMYLIVNLPDAAVEVYRKPVTRSGRYAEMTVMRPGETIQVPLGGKNQLRLPVRKLLP